MVNNDGRVVGKPPIQVAAGWIRDGDRYLITKRKAGVHMEGCWEFPGGKREANESLEACLKRELEEELDIHIASPTPFHVIAYDYPEKSVELHFFLCSIAGGSPQALGCEQWKWVAADEFSQYTFPPADRPIIELLQRQSEKSPPIGAAS